MSAGTARAEQPVEATVLFDAPGPRATLRNRVIGVVGTVIILAGLCWVGYLLRDQYTWDKLAPAFVGESWTQYLLPGLFGTLRAALVAVVLSVVLGLLFGAGRLSTWAWLRAVCGVLVEFFRAVPVLIMMLFAYNFYLFVVGIQGSALSFLGVVTGLTLYNSAVIAELVRSGVHSLPRGQSEAGLALGMPPSRVMFSILLPQAVTAMLPSLVSQLVVILKDTALGYIINYGELLRQSRQLGDLSSDWKVKDTVAMFTVAAIIFIIINFALTTLAGWVERRLRRSSRVDASAVTSAEIQPGGGVAGASNESTAPAADDPLPA